jgi:kynureninase
MLTFAAARGWRINTPLEDHERGGSVVIDVPDGARIADALIKRNVIVDYRPGAGIRLAPHFYNTEREVDDAMEAMAELVT